MVGLGRILRNAGFVAVAVLCLGATKAERLERNVYYAPCEDEVPYPAPLTPKALPFALTPDTFAQLARIETLTRECLAHAHEYDGQNNIVILDDWSNIDQYEVCYRTRQIDDCQTSADDIARTAWFLNRGGGEPGAQAQAQALADQLAVRCPGRSAGKVRLPLEPVATKACPTARSLMTYLTLRILQRRDANGGGIRLTGPQFRLHGAAYCLSSHCGMYVPRDLWRHVLCDRGARYDDKGRLQRRVRPLRELSPVDDYLCNTISVGT